MHIAKCFKILHKELGSIISKEFLQIDKKKVKTQYMKLTLMHLKKTIKDVSGRGVGSRQTSNVNTEPQSTRREAEAVALGTKLLQWGNVSS